MASEIVKLKLELEGFDERPFLTSLSRAAARGIDFTTMCELGDTEQSRRRLYELNKQCSADIPERGEFFTYEEFCRFRYGKHYDPVGAIIARKTSKWIGLCVVSNWSHKGFVFSEMTGVLRDYRQIGIASAMKVLVIRFARSVGAKCIYSTHGSNNPKAIAMNRRLGFVETSWDRLI